MSSGIAVMPPEARGNHLKISYLCFIVLFCSSVAARAESLKLCVASWEVVTRENIISLRAPQEREQRNDSLSLQVYHELELFQEIIY